MVVIFLIPVAAIALVPLITVLEKRGYFDWAQYINVRLLANALLIFLGGIVAFVIMMVHREKRRFPRRPSYVKLLSGYRGPTARPVPLPQPKTITDPKAGRQYQRRRRLQMHWLACYVLIPAIFGIQLYTLGVLALLRTLWPKLDLESWWLIAIILCSWVMIPLLLFAAFGRIIVRRKGPERALRFLCPELLQGQASSIDRFMIYRLLQLRYAVEIPTIHETQRPTDRQ